MNINPQEYYKPDTIEDLLRFDFGLSDEEVAEFLEELNQ